MDARISILCLVGVAGDGVTGSLGTTRGTHRERRWRMQLIYNESISLSIKLNYRVLFCLPTEVTLIKFLLSITISISSTTSNK